MESGTAYIQISKDRWLAYSGSLDVVCVNEYAEVLPALSRIEQSVDSGLYAAGFISYEAAPAFDKALSVHEPSDIPLLWFALYEEVIEISSLPEPDKEHSLSEWTPGTSESEYLSAIEKIKGYIKSGDTYQVNYSIRLNSEFKGDAYSLFYKLQKGQGGRNCAFIDTGDIAVCSLSPELFFALSGDSLKSCPMKGTAQRGLTFKTDQAAAAALHNSIKNRAENVMIVDMIRNDMGRIADKGSVALDSSFDIERYPTVLQMTSTVRSKTSASITDIFKAMFPCASITGAPKVRTMEIIRELESGPRGLYTGAIGAIAPGRKALFNVAIRTVVVDKQLGQAEYGVGGGIIWDSVGNQEYSECLDKSKILKTETTEFSLLETILWSSDDGYTLLEKHISRLRNSAQYFDFNLDEEKLTTALMTSAAEMEPGTRKVRLLLSREGFITIESTPISIDASSSVRLRIASSCIDSTNPFLYHKTTCRDVYTKALNEVGNCDDVLLYNEHGEITESTIANIVISINGKKVTPSVECGLLQGTMREDLLNKGEIEEKRITIEELKRADEIFLINSVRGWRRVVLLLND